MRPFGVCSTASVNGQRVSSSVTLPPAADGRSSGAKPDAASEATMAPRTPREPAPDDSPYARPAAYAASAELSPAASRASRSGTSALNGSSAGATRR